MALILVTHMSEKAKQQLEADREFVSTDAVKNRPVVSKFCQLEGLPVLRRFACACAFDSAVPKGSIAKAFARSDGWQAHLDLSTVLRDVAIVCDADFETTAVNAMKQLDERGRVRRKFHDLIKHFRNQEELREMLEEMVAWQQEMGTCHYIEVRIGRPLIRIDVHEFIR
jgi:hypothetical protein